MLNFCCSQLSTWFSAAGKKGFSVVPKKYEDNSYTVFLQGRNQDAELKEGRVTILQQAISYCPFCGSELNIVMSQNIEKIEYYAAQNKDLVL